MTRPLHSADRLATRVMWGMLAGLVAGATLRFLAAHRPSLAPAIDGLAVHVLDPLGLVFLRLLFFVVVPLIFASLALGIVQLGHLRALGPLATRTFLLFALNMSVGVALGLLIMNSVRPGERLPEDTRTALLEKYAPEAQQTRDRAAAQPHLTPRTILEMFLPANLLRAVTDFQILPLIVFALLTGIAATQLAPPQQQRLHDGLQIVADLMTAIVHFAMRLAPYAVAALLASVVIRAGLEILKSLSLFVLCLLGVMAVHLFGTMSLLLRFFSRRSPRHFFSTIRTVLVTAFSTSSSNATLPTSLQVCREKLGVSPGTAGFVLPLGATLNMSGTALYEGCVVLFVAQVFGVDLSLPSQLLLLVLSVLSAVAVAGIPGASLPLIVGLLANFNVPPEGIALVYGADRLLDMARTTVNVGADLVVACIIEDQGSKPSAS